MLTKAVPQGLGLPCKYSHEFEDLCITGMAERVPDKALYGRFYSQYFSVPITKGCRSEVHNLLKY